ncbi:MAG TPA: hypothetical protein PKB07_09975 [Flavilitoribacter sp.]|nr:hypothetical protein [Flavilitoribacter sp.]
MFFYKIISKESKIVLTSNFPEDYDFIDTETWKTFQQIVSCEITGKKRKQLKVELKNYDLYLIATEKHFDNKKFKTYVESCTYFAEQVFPKYLSSVESEQKRFKRLRHNLISFNTIITNEFYQIVSQELLTTKGGKYQIKLLSDIISTDTTGVANHLLKIFKASTLMKAEIEVYDRLYSPKSSMDFINHKIHKLIMISLNTFWLDLISSQIKVKLTECHECVIVDYTTISVVFSHIFDNSIKYCAPNSELSIDFETRGRQVFVKFNMFSVKIKEEELEKITKEGYSGEWAREKDLSGDGIGMFLAEKLINLNNGELVVEINTEPGLNKKINGIPYEKNQFILKLIKAVS